MPDLLGNAVRYAEIGWRVHPLRPRDKRPLLPNWPTKATTDIATVESWWRQWPDANVGIACGAGSGLWVLDVDVKQDGVESLAQLEDKHGALPFTATAATGAGGEHLYFRWPSGLCIRNSAGRLGSGLDVRGDGGYVCAPPSVHPSGRLYEWLVDQDPWSQPPVDAPDWLVRLVAMPLAAQPAGTATSGGGKCIPRGQRNSHLTSVAGRMRRSGLDEPDIAAALLAINAADCDPPLPEAEVRQIAASVCRYAPGYELTDSGNADRLAAAYAGRLLYCSKMRQWYHWNGRIWANGDDVAVRRAADETVRLLHLEAANTADPDRRKAIARWAHKSEGRQQLASMIELAHHRLPVEPTELDRHPDLLSCENGVIDLRTGALQPHDPALRLTKMVHAHYDPRAQCPQWDAFLRLITTGDVELAHFLQVAAGYVLTGRTGEQCFFLAYGQGGNGKTAFTETLRRLLGDYATKISIESLLTQRSGDVPTPYIASLRGARLAVASEIPRGRSLNESLVKDLTGGDLLTARWLHSNPITFEPTHKLWLYGNNKPIIKGDDLGIWRRVRMIPFRAIIPVEQRRPLDEVLADFDGERDGILRWAIEGGVEWYAGGLPKCAAVDGATAEYRNESDWVTQFLAECCETDVTYREAKSALHNAFRQWVSDQYNEKAPGQRWLTTRLLERGYQVGGHSKGDILGLRLKP